MAGSDVHMMTLHCSNVECMTEIRVGRLLKPKKPTLIIGQMQYCPVCGQKAMSHTDNNETYWESMAAYYELPIALIRMLYDSWEPKDLDRFGDYVRKMKQEAQAEIIEKVS